MLLASTVPLLLTPPYSFAIRSGASNTSDSSSSDTPGGLCSVRSLYRCALWHLHQPRRSQALTCPLCESVPPLPADSPSSRRLLHASCLSTSTLSVSCFLFFDVILLLTSILSFLPTFVEDQPFTLSRLSTHTHYCPEQS